MANTNYIALLRGINVGGKNLIKMSELKLCLEKAGFDNVTTYIQSGNILFSSDETNQQQLARSIEVLLSRTFNYQSRLVLRSQVELHEVIARAPKRFGTEPDQYRYDVIFLKEPLMPDEAMQSVAPKEGVDTAASGPGVLYFSRLISKASQSRLSRIVTLPVYQNMTIRNWNTTTKLLAMLDAQSGK